MTAYAKNFAPPVPKSTGLRLKFPERLPLPFTKHMASIYLRHRTWWVKFQHPVGTKARAFASRCWRSSGERRRGARRAWAAMHPARRLRRTSSPDRLRHPTTGATETA